MASVQVEIEDEALRRRRTVLVERLDPMDNVLEFLQQNKGLTSVMCERIRGADNRIEQCRLLIDAVRQKMIVPLFIDALEYKGSHVKLATMLRDTICTLYKSGWKNEKRRKAIAIQKPTIYTQPGRLEIVDSKGKKLAKIGFELRLLSHKGKCYLKQFEDRVLEMKRKYANDPDVVFKMLESELIKGRLYLENGPDQWSKLNEMERLVATVTHSEAGSMVFLARKAAIVSMEGNFLNVMAALNIAEEARRKMRSLQPCADTARVMFVYVNILIQLYELRPSEENRQRLIISIREATDEHFPSCPRRIMEEFQRIFSQKLACCYLGIGVYGRLFNAVVTRDDVKCAEGCLKSIKSDSVFDDRRTMLYNLAEAAVYYYKELHCPQRTGEFSSLAIEHAKIARRLSDENNFGKELCQIEDVFRHINSISPGRIREAEVVSVEAESTSSRVDEDNFMDDSHTGDVMEEEDMDTWEASVCYSRTGNFERAPIRTLSLVAGTVPVSNIGDQGDVLNTFDSVDMREEEDMDT